MLHGGLHVSRQLLVQNICDAILSAFLMVSVGFTWYCWNSFSFMIVVLLDSVICSSVVIFSSNRCCRYLWFKFGVIVGKLVAFCSQISVRGVSIFGNVAFLVWMCALPLCFRRYSVREVGECKHASLLSKGRCCEPPYFAKMWLVRPL
jgi:hypothetical protein